MWTIGGKSTKTISKRIAFCRDKQLVGGKIAVKSFKNLSSCKKARGNKFENSTSRNRRKRATEQQHLPSTLTTTSSHSIANGSVKKSKISIKRSSFNSFNFSGKNIQENNYEMVDRDSLTSPRPGAPGGQVPQSGSIVKLAAATNVFTSQQNSNTTQGLSAADNNANNRPGTTKAAPTKSLKNTDPSTSNQSALCDIDNNNALADNLPQSAELATPVDGKKTKKSRKDKVSGEGTKRKSGEQRRRKVKIAIVEPQMDFCKIERPEAEGAEDVDFDNDPEAAEWAKLRCTSECTEVIAEREARRQKRCADYPGLAFGRSVFSSDTMMKFNIIRNELHNIMKTQLKRVKS